MTQSKTDGAMIDDTTPYTTPASDAAPDAQDDAPVATHEPTPDDCSDTPPTVDGLNHMGYFRRPAGEDQPEGSTIVIKSHATEDNLTNHERGGILEFLGYAPAPEAAASETVASDGPPAPREWNGARYDTGSAPPREPVSPADSEDDFKV